MGRVIGVCVRGCAETPGSIARTATRGIELVAAGNGRDAAARRGGARRLPLRWDIPRLATPSRTIDIVRTNRLALLFGSCLGALVACHGRPRGSPVPEGVRFVSRAEWGARAPVLPMRRHVPTRITIHHTATAQDANRTVEAKLAALQAFSQRDDSLSTGRRKPAWPDVPYHYYVSVDGTVAEGRDRHHVGDSNTPYDPAGHLLVVVEGNFERDTLSSAQRRTLDAFIPALARRFHVAPAGLAAHRDYAETRCPGQNLYAELPHLRGLVSVDATPR